MNSKDLAPDGKFDQAMLVRKGAGLEARARLCRKHVLRLAYHNHRAEFAGGGAEMEGPCVQLFCGVVFRFGGRDVTILDTFGGLARLLRRARFSTLGAFLRVFLVAGRIGRDAAQANVHGVPLLRVVHPRATVSNRGTLETGAHSGDRKLVR